MWTAYVHRIQKNIDRVHNLAQHGTNLAMGFLMMVIFLAIAFGIFFSTNTTGWNATVVTIWGYLPEVAIAVAIGALAIYGMHQKE